jgi:Flp pilus assembly protein TadG
MGVKRNLSLLRLLRQERGGIAVEFAIIIPILLLLIFGIVDFGHAWYMDHMMSNASREGARYGTRYTTDALNQRVLPSGLTPSISNYILNNSEENGSKGGVGLAHLLPTDANAQVIPSGGGWTDTNPTTLANQDLTVTITATKNWLVIGRLIPFLGSSINLSVSTTMKCE